MALITEPASDLVLFHKPLPVANDGVWLVVEVDPQD